LLALSKTGDFSRDAAMVYSRWTIWAKNLCARRQCTKSSASNGIRRGAKAEWQYGQRSPGLVRFAPAFVGRADSCVLLSGVRRAGRRPENRHHVADIFAKEPPTPGITDRKASFYQKDSFARNATARFSQRDGHSRRLVRFRFIVRRRFGNARQSAISGGRLSRRRRSISRLVQLIFDVRHRAHAAAPYKTVITHGWVVDGEGKQMHKSTGNAISPNEVVGKSGAEILRLWAAAVDYTQDIRCSDEILSRVVDAYRKFRNTLRYALGNLDGFNPETDSVAFAEMLETDRWALASLDEAATKVLRGYENYDFQAVYQTLYNFVTVTLSARYFDIIKDRLYIFAPNSLERRSAQTALYEITDKMCRLLAPVLSFTADEAFENLPHQKIASVHLAEFSKVSGADNSRLLNEWERIFSIRDEVLKALEEARNLKQIGSSLEAKVKLTVNKETMMFLLPFYEDLRYIFIVSQVEVHQGDAFTVVVQKADGAKCERCWNYSVRVGESAKYPTVCERCVGALGEIEKSAAA
jgi:hypothetical protein